MQRNHYIKPEIINKKDKSKIVQKELTIALVFLSLVIIILTGISFLIGRLPEAVFLSPVCENLLCEEGEDVASCPIDCLDTDGDGLPDAWEIYYECAGINPLLNDTDGDKTLDGAEDFDYDGLNNSREYFYQTNPCIYDTDGDELPDGWEISNSLNPISNDTDGDGILDPDENEDGDSARNLEEYAGGSFLNSIDSDSDGVIDGEDPYPRDPVERCPGLENRFRPGILIRYDSTTSPPVIYYPTCSIIEITSDGERYHFNDINHGMDAWVTYNGDEWQLDIALLSSSIHNNITQLSFPYQSGGRYLLNNDTRDDIFYYTYYTGATKKALAVRADYGLVYPGTFSPLVVIADPYKAKIVAATNWPPKKVIPYFSLGNIRMFYDEPVFKSATETTYTTYKAKIVEVTASPGHESWQLALDEYKTWLDSHMEQEGLYQNTSPGWRVNYSDWFKDLNGLSNIMLQNVWPPLLTENDFYIRWGRWNNTFPMTILGGQMSEYDGECCDYKRIIHQNYTRTPPYFNLTKYTKDFTQSGGHVAIYIRPLQDYQRVYLPFDSPQKYTLYDARSETPLEYIQNWSRLTRQWGANTYFIDVYGNRYFGDILFNANLFLNGNFTTDTILEGAIDVYPASFLISGALRGGSLEGNATTTPENSVNALFPRFGRYLLNDRILFMGESLQDYIFWQYWNNTNNYFGERQVFLLGAKFDMLHPWENNTAFDVMNRAVNLSVSEWNRVGWWAREPKYLDTVGITYISPKIDVRRFVDKDGKDLLVIDNWKTEIGNINITLDGKNISINIPMDRSTGLPKRLYIYEQEDLPLIYPRFDFQTPFEVKADETGMVEVSVNESKIRIESYFFHPREGSQINPRNGFAPTELAPDSSWHVDVTQSENRITIIGEGNYYKITREINFGGSKIFVTDKFENKLSQDIGIPFYIDFFSERTDFLISGREGMSRSNPTVFIPFDDAGVGILFDDNVFRAQIGSGKDTTKPNRIDITNDYFGLPAGGEYTFEWQIYPLSSNDYYDFINIVRREKNVNFEIGNHIFLGSPMPNGWMTMSDADRKFFFEQGAIDSATVAFWKKASDTSKVAHGPDTWEDLAPYAEQFVWDAKAKLRATGLDVKYLLYFDLFLSSEDGASTLYSDARIINSSGQHVGYRSETYPYLYRFFPTLTNSYGERLWPVFEEVIDYFDADGIYVDESTYNAFTYNETYWDGYSFQTNKSTGQIVKRIGSVELLSKDYRVQFIQEARNRGYFVLANVPPISKEMVDLHVPTFLEVYWPDAEAAYPGSATLTHLSSPIALCVSCFYNDTRYIDTFLDYGALNYPNWHLEEFYTYSDLYQKIYPITPVALYSGTIIGEEQIITNRVGYFGWNDNSQLTVYYYDHLGNPQPHNFAVVTVNEKTFAKIDVNEGIVIIERAKIYFPQTPGEGGGGGSGGSGGGGGRECTPYWSCPTWSDCINGVQTLVCIDLNSCNSLEGKPDTTRSCDPDRPVGQTSDEDQNIPSRINLPRIFIYGLLAAIIFVALIVMVQLRKSLFHLERKEKEVMQTSKRSFR